MKIFLFILAILIFFEPSIAAGQTKKFRWASEFCDFEGTYDARKYSEAELRNTLRLFDKGGEFNLTTEATVWKHEDIENLSVEVLDREYAAKSEALKKLDLVNSPYWESERQKHLTELEQVYRLSRVTIEAYRNAVVLKDFRFADACVKTYGAALTAGGDDLLNVWRRVNEDSRRKNADPERLRRIFDEQYNSPDRLKFALTEVMSFGWWNCANEFIERVEDDGSQQKAFRKLFTRVRTIGCDEP